MHAIVDLTLFFPPTRTLGSERLVFWYHMEFGFTVLDMFDVMLQSDQKKKSRGVGSVGEMRSWVTGSGGYRCVIDIGHSNENAHDNEIDDGHRIQPRLHERGEWWMVIPVR